MDSQATERTLKKNGPDYGAGSTAQIYTRVSVEKLAEIHAATHPGAKLNKRIDDTSSLTISSLMDVYIRQEKRAKTLPNRP